MSDPFTGCLYFKFLLLPGITGLYVTPVWPRVDFFLCYVCLLVLCRGFYPKQLYNRKKTLCVAQCKTACSCFTHPLLASSIPDEKLVKLIPTWYSLSQERCTADKTQTQTLLLLQTIIVSILLLQPII